MKIATVKKELDETDFKKLKKAGKRAPEFLYRRKSGSQIRVKEQDLRDYSEYIEEVGKASRSRKTDS